ncbi:TPA: hypothetical protein DCG86_09200 [Candidatus Marinimicrobia bacterium]|nr:MAG: hypothetical protein XD77_0870 [Marinimicrobia bacterium 46_47]HAE88183.1 hypothetical protein [Candidatus Neomarinimicrobiota bacterium]
MDEKFKIVITLKEGLLFNVHTNIDNLDLSIYDFDDDNKFDSEYESEIEGLLDITELENREN